MCHLRIKKPHKVVCVDRSVCIPLLQNAYNSADQPGWVCMHFLASPKSMLSNPWCLGYPGCQLAFAGFCMEASWFGGLHMPYWNKLAYSNALRVKICGRKTKLKLGILELAKPRKRSVDWSTLWWSTFNNSAEVWRHHFATFSIQTLNLIVR